MVDELSTYYADLLDGSYDCVDRIVLNAYHTLCYSPGGFRAWWRQLMNGQEDTLDNAHLMRMAGRFSRRARAYAKAHGIPVIDCARGDRKHEIAEEYLSTQPEARGLFMILVARAQAPVWEVQRSTRGAIRNLAAKKPYVNHYSFHILDPEWGHLTIKMSGHPPLRGANHPERARIRRRPGPAGRAHRHEGGELFHPYLQRRRPGARRRDLV